jgi:topoisomerase-4 subunit B
MDTYGEIQFMNGRFTTQGRDYIWLHLEGYVRTIREYFKRDYDASDIRSILQAISVKLQEPVFEKPDQNQTGAPGRYLKTVQHEEFWYMIFSIRAVIFT